MDIFEFTPPFVFHTKVNRHEEVKQIYLPKILEEFEKNKLKDEYYFGGRKTNLCHSNIEKPPSVFDKFFFDNVIFEPLNELLRKHQIYKNQEIKTAGLNKIWWNVYDTGDHVYLHDHGESVFFKKIKISGFYLLNLEGKNLTAFSSPDGCLDFEKLHNTNYAQEGETFLFPSSLKHYSPSTDGNKVSVSFNVFCEFY
jgi:hypothetical protein